MLSTSWRPAGTAALRAALCRGDDGLFVPSPPPTLQIPTVREALALQSIGLKTCQTINTLLSTKEHGSILLLAQLHALFSKSDVSMLEHKVTFYYFLWLLLY